GRLSARSSESSPAAYNRVLAHSSLSKINSGIGAVCKSQQGPFPTVRKINRYGGVNRTSSLIQDKSNPTVSVVPFRRHEPCTQPDYLYPAYRATRLRAPSQPLIFLPHTLSEVTGPVFGQSDIHPNDRNLTVQQAGEALGERIIVRGRVLDGDGHPVSNSLIEIWQANAAGRYAHAKDDHPAPLDPNFTGTGRTLTDKDGFYSFVTIKPGAYPWRNHDNAWRPAHIHFSLFGPAFVTRLITQMYFPGDPLFAYDPILQSIPDERARQRLVSKFDLETTKPDWALGYRFDIVLRGRESTPFER
ncbi:MAG TPA: protocatechuate 3,4-dioxygenase subunit beta, partial [Candidatus Acidoferrum sp.]|nr:protocatechuate 3,4-dioxygenase subunit beta [Candidatus Acidoferrum sp.]